MTEGAHANPGTEQEGATLGSRTASATSRSKANFLRPSTFDLWNSIFARPRYIYCWRITTIASQSISASQSTSQPAYQPTRLPAYQPTYKPTNLPTSPTVSLLPPCLPSHHPVTASRGTIACRTRSFGTLLRDTLLWYSLLWDSLLWNNCVWETLPLGTLHSVLVTSILMTNVGSPTT